MKKGILRMVHKKCRNNIYPLSNVQRFAVSDDKVDWVVNFAEYYPVHYTSKILENKQWADPPIEDSTFCPKWNQLDNNVNRVSFINNYSIDGENYPLNPCGRTGIRGRGVLGRWGPNHAADPIVTRWSKEVNSSIKLHKVTKKPILQFIVIQRRDSGEWALPGGMVDPGEKVSVTLHREFMEEAMNSLGKSASDLKDIQQVVDKFFQNGEEIYKGYVDDPRNTDNAWMETVAYNFHDDNGEVVGNMNLQAGDDAKSVSWIDISNDLVLYASHKDLIKRVVEKFNAHW